MAEPIVAYSSLWTGRPPFPWLDTRDWWPGGTTSSYPALKRTGDGVALRREAPETLAQRNGPTAQVERIYRVFDDRDLPEGNV